MRGGPVLFAPAVMFVMVLACGISVASGAEPCRSGSRRRRRPGLRASAAAGVSGACRGARHVAIGRAGQ